MHNQQIRTKLVWNSARSTLRVLSNLREAVMEDTILPISLLRIDDDRRGFCSSGEPSLSHQGLEAPELV